MKDNIIYKISAGREGVSTYEKRIVKETEKTIVIENDHYTNLKKTKLDIVESGIIYDSFVMYTLSPNQEKIEEVRSMAKKRWTELKVRAVEALRLINSEAKCNRLQDRR